MLNIDLKPTRPSGIVINEGGNFFHVEDAAQTWQFRFPRSVAVLLLLRDTIEYLIAISAGQARTPQVLPAGVTIQRNHSFLRVIGLDRKRAHDDLFQVMIPADPEALERLAQTIEYLQHHQRQKSKVTRPTAATALCALFAVMLFFLALPTANAQSLKSRLWCANQHWIGLFQDNGTISYEFIGRWTNGQKRRFLERCDVVIRHQLQELRKDAYRKHAHAQQRRTTQRGSSPRVSKGVDPSTAAATVIARTHPLLYLLWQVVPWKDVAAQIKAMPPALETLPPTCTVGQHVRVNGITYQCVARSRVSSVLSVVNRPLLLRTSQDRLYRTQLREASTRPANFAGHYVLAVWGCGSECIMGAAIDTRTGRVAWLPFAVCCWASIGEPTQPLLFRLDNNAVIVTGKLITATETREAKYVIYRLVNGRFIR